MSVESRIEELETEIRIKELTYGNILKEQEYLRLTSEPPPVSPSGLTPLDPSKPDVEAGLDYPAIGSEATEEDLLKQQEVEVRKSKWAEKGKEVMSKIDPYGQGWISAETQADRDYAEETGKPYKKTILKQVSETWDWMTRQTVDRLTSVFREGGLTLEEQEGRKYEQRMLQRAGEAEGKAKKKKEEERQQKTIELLGKAVKEKDPVSKADLVLEYEKYLETNPEDKRSLADIWEEAKSIPWGEAGEELVLGAIEDLPLWIAGFGTIKGFLGMVKKAKTMQSWARALKTMKKADQARFTSATGIEVLGPQTVTQKAAVGAGAKIADIMAQIPAPIKMAAGFSSEVGVFLTADAITSGEIPDWETARNLALLVGGIKVTKKGYDAARRILRDYKAGKMKPGKAQPEAEYRAELTAEAEPAAEYAEPMGVSGKPQARIATEGVEKRTYKDLVKETEFHKTLDKNTELKTLLDNIAQKRYSRKMTVKLTQESGPVFKGREALDAAGYGHLEDVDPKTGKPKEYEANGKIDLLPDGQAEVTLFLGESGTLTPGHKSLLIHEAHHNFYESLKSEVKQGFTQNKDLWLRLRKVEDRMNLEAGAMGYAAPMEKELFPVLSALQLTGEATTKEITSLLMYPEDLLQELAEQAGTWTGRVGRPKTIAMKRTRRIGTTEEQAAMRGTKDIPVHDEGELMKSIEEAQTRIEQKESWLREHSPSFREAEAAKKAEEAAKSKPEPKYKGPERRVPWKKKLRLGNFEDQTRVANYLKSKRKDYGPEAIRDFIKSGQTLPEGPKAKRKGVTHERKDELKRERALHESMLRGKMRDEVESFTIQAKNIPDKMELEGVTFTRIKTRQKGLVRIVSENRQLFDFEPTEDVEISPETYEKHFAGETAYSLKEKKSFQDKYGVKFSPEAGKFVENLKAGGTAETKIKTEVLDNFRESGLWKPEAFKKRKVETSYSLKKKPPKLDKTELPKEYQEHVESKAKPSKSHTLLQAIGTGLQKALTPVSSRLEAISPKLKTRVRRHIYDVNSASNEYRKKVKPLLTKMKRMNPDDSKVLDLALKNRDKEMVDTIMDKYGMTKDYVRVQHVLDDLWSKAKSAGYDVGWLDDYWPRVISDKEGLLNTIRGTENWSVLKDALEQKQKGLTRTLTKEEKRVIRETGDEPPDKVKSNRPLTSDEIIEVTNMVLKGYNPGMSKIPSNVKQRKINKLSTELDRFYLPSSDALLKYIDSINQGAVVRRFFGKSLVVDPESGKIDLSDSIGAYTADLLLKDQITPKQESELRGILDGLFNPGRTGEVMSVFRNIEYIDTMGSPSSALTQIQDIAFAMHNSGVFSALVQYFSKKPVKMEDVSVTKIAQEFAEPSKTAKAVEAVFKATGLTFMDRLGKETLINASFKKMVKQAKKKDVKLWKKLEPIFGDETGQVIDDLVNNKITDNVKYLLFNEIADFQPIALSEMPEYYLKSGNLKVLYMLKSFTIKQVDVFRRAAFKDIKEAKGAKEKVAAIGRLARLAGAFIAMGMVADSAKDLVFGRDFDLTDTVVDNIWKTLGLSKYQIWQFRMEGARELAIKMIAPPFKIIEGITRDYNKLSKDDFEAINSETIQSIPLGGKLFYWWFGKGKQKVLKRRRQKIWEEVSDKKKYLTEYKDLLKEDESEAREYLKEHKAEIKFARKGDILKRKFNKLQRLIDDEDNQKRKEHYQKKQGVVLEKYENALIEMKE
jgi:hypothetical protein